MPTMSNYIAKDNLKLEKTITECMLTVEHRAGW